jgi:hypothetical protein
MSLELKALKQIDVCTITCCAVNCGKGMEYCQGCGQQKTKLITLEEAQKEQRRLAKHLRDLAELCNQKDKQIVEANKILNEIPETVGAHLPSQNDLQIIYHQEELRQWLLRLKMCLSQEDTVPLCVQAKLNFNSDSTFGATDIRGQKPKRFCRLCNNWHLLSEIVSVANEKKAIP